MSTTVAVEDITLSVPDFLNTLTPGVEVVLTRGREPVAKLVVAYPKPTGPRPAPGLGKGSLIYMPDDFDAPMEDFKEYME